MKHPIPVIAYEHAEATRDRVTVYDFCEIRDIDSLRICPYCKSSYIQFPEHTDDKGLCQCGYCGWWKLLDLKEVSHGFGAEDIQSISAIAKEFKVSSLNVPIRALRSYLMRHPRDIVHVDPKVFERLIADCLRDAFNPCEVIHVGRSDDGGIDLKLILANDACYLVQVKRRSFLDRKEGVEVVRSLNGVLFKEGIPRGMVITTAHAFTPRAHESTQIATPTSVPYDMKLVAFDEVISMLRLKPIFPYEPWKRFSFRDNGIERQP